ncbi:DNA circularization N-terminal domain-containing protein [Novispirillum itersonii]|uniref:DNA circularization N-terminal domain-containing protein n=1 Tax=Novispirillum itersonii TaxID=189 RepID=UPI0004772C00|nr:DNA circularization N-terminal domain-containing protein [Novispirillum itersonii]
MKINKIGDVEFHVNNITDECGNRLVTHEYPQRDVPFIENLGNKARKLTISGALFSDDVSALCAQLTKICNGADPVKLTLDLIGELEVYCESLSLTHDNQSQRMAAFSLTVQPVGEQRYPEGRVSTSDRVVETADALDSASITNFINTFDVAGWPGYVQEAAEFAAASTIELLGATLGVGLDGGALLAVARNPAGLAAEFVKLFGGVHEMPGIVEGLSTFQDSQPVVQVPRQTGTTAHRQALNAAAINQLTNVLSVTTAARAAASNDAPAYDDAVGDMNTITSMIDKSVTSSAAGGAGTVSLYREMKALRASVITDTTERASRKPRVTVASYRDRPSPLITSYRHHGTSRREAEIMTRNNIVSPFIIPDEYKVLTK